LYLNIFVFIVFLWKKMTRLSETRVQMAALQYLERKYQRWARGGRVFSDIEVHTRRKAGGKRADGLLAYRPWIGGTRVVSMEAKSYNTLRAIRPRLNIWQFLGNCARAGFIICVLSGAFFTFYRFEDTYWQFAIPINTLVIGALLYGALTRNHYGHLTVDMIRQLTQYPANFRWLAVSRDSLGALSQEKRTALLKICRHQGVGLLSVNGSGYVEEVVKARKKSKWFGDFLSVYAREAGIRKELR
jgi:hypothetical protein